MLSAEELVTYRSKPIPDLPHTGHKGFKPTNTCNEQSQIDSSLAATKELLSHERVRLIGSLSQAAWLPALGLAEVTVQTGSHWSSMGHIINKKLHIYPEEAIYLLEMGSIEINFNGVSISTQRAYSLLLAPQTEVSLEQYRVYSHLTTHGYVVLRHLKERKSEKQADMNKSGVEKAKRKLEVTDQDDAKKFKSDGGSRSEEVLGEAKTLEVREMVELKREQQDECRENCRNFPVGGRKAGESVDEWFNRLQIIRRGGSVSSRSSLKFAYDAYLPNSKKKTFRKASLDTPSFRILISGHNDAVQSPDELAALTATYPDDVAIIHAVVFPDFVGFFQVASNCLPDISDTITLP